MNIAEWITLKGGIVHRAEALDAGWRARGLRAAVGAGAIQVIRRDWLATADAPLDLRAAAAAGGRIGCVTLARERGWWMPEGADDRRHLSVKPHARNPGESPEHVIHWTKPLAPVSRYALRESVEDALAHIAECAPYESAHAIWESAARVEKLSAAALQRVQWTGLAARRLADEITELSDSGLESIFVTRLGPWGLPLRQQLRLAGRFVDLVIGDSLVIQIDGYAHHSSAAARTRDVAHDAELTLRGYTVLHFTYAQIIHDWPAVERTIARAIAAGLHLRTVRSENVIAVG
ncbi:hypothetical protein GCM10009775_19810 [Microbacterium aoyamense]|uniref:DUF559 domain-containing protein n=1 Tax=Microbacterium aoyamense TaxID=344166 RepID=A0ABN2PPE8_9MICO|nr:DUF559 domain-containing protein [Microbacterium aoyamense]